MPDSHFFCFKNGSLKRSDGKVSEDISPNEEKYMVYAEETTQRWGERPAMLSPLKCHKCAYYLKFDAGYDFHDYGVCTSAASVYDRQVVNSHFGCSYFLEDLL
jgi:hypothetical protein